MSRHRLKPRCCIITTVHSPFDPRIFHKQARTLAKAGYEVVLVAPHDRYEVLDGVKIIPLPRSCSRIFRMLHTITALRLALRQEANVYHFHDPELIYIGLILKLFRKKVIYDVHEDYSYNVLIKEWIPAILRRPISVSIGIIEHIAARAFEGVVAATSFIAEGFPNNRTVVVRNFPSIEHFKQLTENSRDPSGPPVAIYAGGLGRMRGIRQIIRAFSLIQGAELWLVGRFEDLSFEEEIRNLVPPNVKILGLKPFEEVILLYKRASIGLVCLLPTASYLESVPVKLFEYMAAGLPVVASNFPTWHEFVDGCGVLVNPEDVGDIADAVKKLLADPILLQRMGERGKRKVLEKYNWEHESSDLLNLYERVLGIQ